MRGVPKDRLVLPSKVKFLKFWAITILGAMALMCGLVAVHFWGASTKVQPSPQGIEPGDPEMKRIWWNLAEYEACKKIGRLNRLAAYWTGAAAILGFASAIIGAWPNLN